MKTKNRYYIFRVIIYLTVIYSCQEKNVSLDIFEKTSHFSFEACDYGNYVTKTSRVEDGSVWWSPNEEIKVFCKSSYGKFTSQNTECSPSATFLGEFNSDITPKDIETNGVIAFYPYSSDITCIGRTITYTLPDIQIGKTETFNEGLFPSIATSNNKQLLFRNICGGVKFTVARDDIKTVTFRSINNEIIAGTIKVSFDDSANIQVEIEDGVSQVVVQAPDNTFEVGKSYYIVLLPQILERGFELIYNEGEAVDNIVVCEKPIVIEPSKFGVLDKLDIDLAMIDANSLIPFADNIMKEVCINAFDRNGDGEISYIEAREVTDLSQMELIRKDFKSFDEFRYFTSVRFIPQSCFRGTELQSIIIPNSIHTIAPYAFQDCTNLEHIKLPYRLISISDRVFYSCSSLKNIEIPESVSYMGVGVFDGCKNLVKVNIPKSMSFIQYSTFANCASLSAIYIPEVIKYIYDKAFMGCYNLKTIYVSL